MRESRAIEIMDTQFIFDRNLSGNPEKNGKYKSKTRSVNVIIPTEAQAMEMQAQGIKVGVTKPYEGEEAGFIPKFFVRCIANYETAKQPPLIYLVPGDKPPVLLDATSVAEVDFAYVTNVKVAVNPWPNQNDGITLYIQVMYVECQEVDAFASYYKERGMQAPLA